MKCPSVAAEILRDRPGAVDRDRAEATRNESRRAFVVWVFDAPRGNGPTILGRPGGELRTVRPGVTLRDGTAGGVNSRLLGSVVACVRTPDESYE